ncbi:MAG TPA: hemerythrin domain-containing protein [Kofleriaceae bacterium]|nr:hemerythrin domain-containing protein [Kofleriaceae bacterium]
MLFQLGSRAVNGDIADLLLACHHRIREQLALARRIANAPAGTSAESIRAAAERVRRYFAIAFPLHRQDEEDDLFPRLAGRSDTLDAAIRRLSHDHDAHEAHVARLVALCVALEREPETHAARARELADVANEVELELVQHLALEERVVFPAIEMLAADERQAILQRMRARRDDS